MGILEGKTAIVTGASRGIGRSIALEMCNEGAQVLAVARDPAALATLCSEAGPTCHPFAADLREQAAAAQVTAAAIVAFGSLHILVNNAGATQRGNWFDLPDDAWQDGFSLKFFGAMRLCRAAWPHLAQSGGCIINIGGIGGRAGSADFTIGGSVNAAVMHLTKSLAELGVRDGVRVNAINPGSIETGRLSTRIRNHAAERGLNETAAAAELAQMAGIARFGQPQEIARTAIFLASSGASYINGALLDVDGGANRAL